MIYNKERYGKRKLCQDMVEFNYHGHFEILKSIYCKHER